MTAITDKNISKKNQQPKDLCMYRWAWGLLIVGLFILCISMLGTILAWDDLTASTHLHAEHIISNGTFEDEGDLDISISIKGKNARSHVISKSAITDEYNCNISTCALYCYQSNVDLYKDMLNAMQPSTCDVLRKACFTNRDFDAVDFEKETLTTNLKVGEVVFKSCNFKPAARNLFKTSFFDETYLLAVQYGRFHVAPDFLVGLVKLRYLTIETTVKHLPPTFFKHVSKTLTNLIINANLSISTKHAFFGKDDMSALTSLDLSRNYFVGSLTNVIFSQLAKLQYLRLQECQITSIEGNFLESFSKNLIFIDLSRNLLKTLPGDFIKSANLHKDVLIDLNYNNWICNCEFEAFFNNYLTYKANFLDGAFCSKPAKLQGTLWKQIENFKKICKQNTIKDAFNKQTPVLRHAEPQIKLEEMVKATVPTPPVHPPETTTTDLPLTTETTTAYSYTTEFPPADYDFVLSLLENNVVRVEIINYTEGNNINIVWFAELTEKMVFNSIPIDYNCDKFVLPYIDTSALEPDTTYTFCLIPAGKTTITPYNCLPVYIPAESLSGGMEIWIPEEYKNLTLSMLAVTLFISLLCGAFIAYFGLKNFPHLLEGSKHVLVVKSDNPNCISTICDMDTSKRSSIFKPCLETVPERQHSICKSSTDSLYGKNLDAIPSYCISKSKNKNICIDVVHERDAYEVPENPYEIGRRLVQSTACVVSPNIPPPLPQRNSK